MVCGSFTYVEKKKTFVQLSAAHERQCIILMFLPEKETLLRIDASFVILVYGLIRQFTPNGAREVVTDDALFKLSCLIYDHDDIDDNDYMHVRM